jgi:hypothetical protein
MQTNRKYEALGTLLVIIGTLALVTHTELSLPFLACGFVVFLIGRFL